MKMRVMIHSQNQFQVPILKYQDLSQIVLIVTEADQGAYLIKNPYI